MYSQIRKIKNRTDNIFGPKIKLLTKVGIEPYHLTLLSIVVGIIGIYFLFSLVGIILIIFYIILDCGDGLLARVTGKASKFGKWLDFFADRVIATIFLIKYYYVYSDILLPLVGLLLILLLSMAEILESRNFKKVSSNEPSPELEL